MSTHGRLRAALSLEGQIDGKVHREFEYTFYVKIKDFKQLEGAVSIEQHEQWQLPLDSNPNLRTRLRLIDNRRPTMTTKLRSEGMEGADEVDFDIPMDAFKQLRTGAVNGYKKTRYCFKISGSDRVWEVDVFLSHTGQPHPWVKVDFEIDRENRKAIPDFPIDIEDVILEDGPKQTMEQKRFVRQLWQNEWLRLDEGYAPVTQLENAIDK